MTYTWNGPYHRGAMRQHRELKRLEAVERNSKTPPERRRCNRPDTPTTGTCTQGVTG